MPLNFKPSSHQTPVQETAPAVVQQPEPQPQFSIVEKTEELKKELVKNDEIDRLVSKIDINDFLVQCRINGFFSLDDVDTAILEQNGKISFLPKVQARPVNVHDMNIAANQEKLSITVILDGHIMDENLKLSGNNKKWLENELQKQKIGNVKDVFIALCNDDNTLSVYKKVNDSPKNDPFQ